MTAEWSASECGFMFDEWTHSDGGVIPMPFCIQHPTIRGQEAVMRHLIEVIERNLAVVEAQIFLSENAGTD